MIGNPLPWIVIASVVLVTLYLKGHLRLPTPKSANANPPGVVAGQLTNDPFGENTQAILAKYGSHDLAIAFATAARREAEQTIAYTAARKVGDDLRAMFTAPFSTPDPAGQAPPGGSPPPPL